MIIAFIVYVYLLMCEFVGHHVEADMKTCVYLFIIISVSLKNCLQSRMVVAIISPNINHLER